MGLSELLWACRRRWRLIVVVVALAMAAGWLTTPARATPTSAQPNYTYHATEILLPAGAGISFGRLALIATQGDVPAAIRLQFGAKSNCDTTVNKHNGARSTCIGPTTVTLTQDMKSKSFRIMATDLNAQRAVAVATALTDRLMRATASAATKAYNNQWTTLDDERAQYEKTERTLFSQLAAATVANSPDQGTLRARHDAMVRLLGDTQQRLLHLEHAKPPTQQFTIFQRPIAVRESVSSGLGLHAPQSPMGRLLLAALLGLFLGMAGAILLNRQSETVYGVPSIEAAAMLPVITEIPYINAIGKRRYDILTQSVPASRIAEAYRGLRTTISMMWIGNAKREGDSNSEHSDLPRVLMVASPGPSEGKSTTTANLAATYAETGRRVVVIDLDQRRQKLHKFVGAAAEPHLAWADDEQTTIDYETLVQNKVY